jgi:HlyD family secretion protein
MSHDKATLDDLRIDRAARPAARGSVAGWIALGLLGVFAAAAVWWFQRPQAIAVRTELAREVATTGTGGKRTLLNASGYVTARREATVSSKVTGKVVEVLIEEGMKVEAGQVLARLDASNVQASLRLAEAQRNAARSALQETKVRLEEAGRELRRVTQLADNKIATQADLDRADAEVRSLQARLEKQMADVAVADQELALWQQQLEDTIIRAPFAGVVTVKSAQPGEMISPLSAGGAFTRTGICTIVDMASLEIEVDVNESFINRVEPEQTVEATLDSYSDWKIPAKVIAIIPTADRQKATVKVRVGFDKLDPRILPDMGVKVAFQAGEPASSNGSAPRTLTVPASAVRSREGRDIVWVVADNRVAPRAVTVGGASADAKTITEGLNAGERIVVLGPETLSAGSRVKEMKP